MNEINLKDSKDFEKKIFSSTPDSSNIFYSSGDRVKIPELPREVADYRITNAPSYDFDERKSDNKKITISIPTTPYDSNSFNEENEDYEGTLSDITN